MQQPYTSIYTKNNNSPYLSFHKLIQPENPAREEFTFSHASATTPIEHRIKASLEANYLYHPYESNGQPSRNYVKIPCTFCR